MKKLITSAYKAQALTSLSVIVAFGAGFTFEPSNLNALNKPEEITKLFDVTGGDKNTSDSSENQKTWTDFSEIPEDVLGPLTNELQTSMEKLSRDQVAFSKKVEAAGKKDLEALETEKDKHLRKISGDYIKSIENLYFGKPQIEASASPPSSLTKITKQTETDGLVSILATEYREKADRLRSNVEEKVRKHKIKIREITNNILKEANVASAGATFKAQAEFSSSVRKLSPPSLSLQENGSNLAETEYWIRSKFDKFIERYRYAPRSIVGQVTFNEGNFAGAFNIEVVGGLNGLAPLGGGFDSPGLLGVSASGGFGSPGLLGVSASGGFGSSSLLGISASAGIFLPIQRAIIPKGPEGCLALGNHYIQDYYSNMGVEKGAHITKEGFLAYPRDIELMPTKFDKDKSISFQKYGQNLEIHLDKNDEGQLKSVSTKLDVGNIYTDFTLENGQCRVEKIRLRKDSAQKDKDIVIYDSKFCPNNNRESFNKLYKDLSQFTNRLECSEALKEKEWCSMWFAQYSFENQLEKKKQDNERERNFSRITGYHSNKNLISNHPFLKVSWSSSDRGTKYEADHIFFQVRDDCNAPLLALEKLAIPKNLPVTTPVLTKPLDPSIPQVYTKDSFKDAHLLDGQSKHHEAVDKSSDGTMK